MLSSWTLAHPDDGWAVWCFSRDGGQVTGAKGLVLGAHHARDASPRLDVLLTPGGEGTRPLLRDPEHLDWVRVQRQSAQLLTSVCTGSLIYAAAGLLRTVPPRCTGAHSTCSPSSS